MDNGSFLPLIPLRGALLFPDTSGNFDIGREKSVVAAQEAFAAGGFILFASQKDDRNMDPAFSDLRETATIAKILSLSPSGNKALRVHAEGVRRVSLLQKDAPDGQNYLSAYFSEIEMTNSDEIGSMAYRKNLFLILDELSMYHNGVTREGLSMIRNASDETVVNSAATLLTIRDAYPILAETDIYRRYEFLTDALIYEMEVVKAEKKINIKVKHSLEKAQKDHILREQMRIISDELDDSGDREFQKKIALIDAPDEVKEKLTKDLQRLKKISAMSPEYSILTEYIEYSTELPWRKCSEEIHDLIYAKNILDRDHYGLTKVKERILEYIAVHNLTRSFRSPILCFIGPPGVGKTSIARSVAEATGRKFVRMSLGGISDEAEIRGHRKTYVAAMAGRILNGIKQVGVSNPVFLLDEIDKLTKNNRGDPASALLEVLDPEQNSTFRDNYL
ncbi:MAG: AAA family ATPase, partial [Clostridiales bacterium]|nr:AAA family ATPase [Clostridiales bacterium]